MKQQESTRAGKFSAKSISGGFAGGEPKTLQQFLDHLRKRVVPGREVVRDQSPVADILNRYETYLRSECGLVTVTILHYQDFVRWFLLERFLASSISQIVTGDSILHFSSQLRHDWRVSTNPRERRRTIA